MGVTAVANHCTPYVLHESYTLNVLQSRTHGLDHWWRVWKNAQLVQEPGTDLTVVSLFALFHDSMRYNDNDDPGHSTRGFKLWERFNQLEDVEQYLTRQQQEIFFEACAEHSGGYTSPDPTIGACWDADRLDLHRLGIWPDPHYMSTQAGIALASNRFRNQGGR